jgi:hypothetical protein
MARTVFDVLIEKLQDQEESMKTYLAGGSPDDFAKYREVVGVVRGLRYAQQTIEDLAKNYVDGDDDE